MRLATHRLDAEILGPISGPLGTHRVEVEVIVTDRCSGDLVAVHRYQVGSDFPEHEIIRHILLAARRCYD
ncbi:MAG TPA: hypothetical protein VFV93_12700 [Thermomicrobiales bacterium]|nr:hypothetical protein [Thermomicrobiales bacterium]